MGKCHIPPVSLRVVSRLVAGRHFNTPLYDDGDDDEGGTCQCRLQVSKCIDGRWAAHLSQLIREEQRLQKRVHVAGRSLVLQPDTTRVFFRVPATGLKTQMNQLVMMMMNFLS